MSWAGDYSSLQEFVEDKLCLVGKWSSIGGEKKQFEGGNIVINWWKNKKYLAISGEKASDIVCRLTTLFTDTYIFDDHCTAAVDVENPINNNCSCLRVESTVETECMKKNCNVVEAANATINPNMTNIGGQICHCKCKELSTDFEGIKLDLVVNERIILDNTSRISKVEGLLARFQTENEEMKRQLSSFEAKITEPLNQTCIHQTPEPHVDLENNTRASSSLQCLDNMTELKEAESFVSVENPLEDASFSGEGLGNNSVIVCEVFTVDNNERLLIETEELSVGPDNKRNKALENCSLLKNPSYFHRSKSGLYRTKVKGHGGPSPKLHTQQCNLVQGRIANNQPIPTRITRREEPTKDRRKTSLRRKKVKSSCEQVFRSEIRWKDKTKWFRFYY
jgi:hypothetical protein